MKEPYPHTELEKLAVETVKEDIVAAFASYEDCMIYEHFFIKGFEKAKEILSSQGNIKLPSRG